MSLWYRTGTVSVNNGLPAVIGAGTAWIAAKIQPGDAIVLDGRDYEVLTVDSNTAITLVSPYLGATTAGMAYVIKPLSAVARLVELSTELGELLGSFGEIARTQGVGRFDVGQLIDNILRPSLRGKADDDTGINLPGGNVIEQVQGGVKTSIVAADGTPSGPMWAKAPISTAATAALDGKADKAYRTTPAGTTNSAERATWRSIGVIAFGPSDPARITVYGTGGYGDLDACSGETVIHLRGTNDSTGRGLEGHFYGQSKGNGTIAAVAVLRIDTSHWRVFVKAGQYMALSAVCDTATNWVPDNSDTGSGDLPSGSRLIESRWRLTVDGMPTLSVSRDRTQLEAGDFSIVGNGRITFGPNSDFGGILHVGAGSWGAITPDVAQLLTTDGNAHMDPKSSKKIYLGFYRGQGIVIGNGQQQVAAEISNTGEWRGTNIYPRADNAYEIGNANARYASISLATNPQVTSDARRKLNVKPALGLPFVLALYSAAYRIADAKVSVETEDDGYEEVQEQVYEARSVADVEIVIVDGRPVRRAVEREEQVPVFDQLPLVDEAGEPVLDQHGKPVMHPVPRMQTVRRPKTRQVCKVAEGVRWHQGFLAQQVLEVLQSLGLSGEDFAGLIYDKDTDTWGLRYEQFIAPLVAAVQTLAARIKALEARDA